MNNPNNNQENNRELSEGDELELHVFTELQQETYVLRLYIAQNNFRSVQALKSIQKLCDQYLNGRYQLEIIDIYENPERLEEEQIFAIPTLVKELPLPLQRLIGDMTDIERVKICLSL